MRTTITIYEAAEKTRRKVFPYHSTNEVLKAITLSRDIKALYCSAVYSNPLWSFDGKKTVGIDRNIYVEFRSIASGIPVSHAANTVLRSLEFLPDQFINEIKTNLGSRPTQF